MAKRHHIDLTSEQEQPVFVGIACRLKDYQLSFHINRNLGFQFKKLPDFPFIVAGQQNACWYSLYRFQDADRRLEYFLLANHHPDSKLIPVYKQTDYFLLVSGECTANETEQLIRSIREVPEVLLAYYLDLSKVKQIDTLLSDLELHILESDTKAN